MTSDKDTVWQRIRQETQEQAGGEPILASFLHATILNHSTLEQALSFHLANMLDSPTASSLLLRDVILEAFESDACIPLSLRADLLAVEERDSACNELSMPFLYFKGFHALQTHRVAHWLWGQGRESLALFFQNRMSSVFGVDIHPAATLGHGIMLDHATGLVIGATAVVGNNVSILQSVTLGNIRVGEGAKVGAGSVVLEEVPPHTTVAGVPAKIVGHPASDQPALEMEHDFCCDEDTGAAVKSTG